MALYLKPTHQCLQEREEVTKDFVINVTIDLTVFLPFPGDKEYEESSRSRCWFDLRLYGDWVLYEADRKEEVKVDRDSLTFSLLGNFRCWKTLSETDYLYTTLSKFRNGW